MPSKPVPTILAEEIRSHLADHGLGQVADGQIAAPTARRTNVLATWWRDFDRILWFRCLRCPVGFDRYRTDVYQQTPSPQIIAAIRNHFRDEHAEPSLPEAAVYHDENRIENAAAVFMPMLPGIGAGFICNHCPQGMNRRYVTPPPYGDARRLHQLLRDRPHLYDDIRHLTGEEQADYLNAWDTGQLQRRQAHTARVALDHPGRRARREFDLLDETLQQLLIQRTGQGEKITPLIHRLDHLSKTDPVGLARELATVVPALTDEASSGDDDERLLARAATLLNTRGGYPPTASKTRLWQLWRSRETQ